MELSLRLDTLGLVEMNYLRSRERYRDWPPFQLLAASRQARILAYLTHDVAEQLHEQILMVEAAVGLDVDDSGGDEDDEDEEELTEEEQELDLENNSAGESSKAPERESSSFSPSFAQALERLNELARQRLPEGSVPAAAENTPTLPPELTSEIEASLDEEDAIEQLQEAFIQMMAVVRELAEELATDALKLTGRFRCGRTRIEFVQAEMSDDEDEDGTEDEEDDDEDGEIELVMVLQLYEEGHSRPDDLPVAELQLDVDDFERLHESLDIAFEHERRSSRRRR